MIYQHNQAKGGYKGFKPIGPFRIGIHDPMSVADLHGKGATVNPGYVSTFIIKPSQIITSQSAKNLPLEKRECLFKNDSVSLFLIRCYMKILMVSPC